jgi:amino acid transporter
MEQEKSHRIGLSVAVVIGLNAMIGAGIVAIPSFLSQEAGPAGILAFAFSILVVLCMSLSLAKLAELYPGEGWSYYYPSLLGGHNLGMLSAWCYLIAAAIAMGFLVQQAGVWLNEVMPIASPLTLGLIILSGLTALVLAGAQVSAWGQYAIAAVVVFALVFTSLLCLGHASLANFVPFAPKGINSIFAAAPKAMFTLLGFESIASLYSIVRDPGKNVPRASVLSVLLVGSLYLIFAASILSVVSGSEFEGAGHMTLAALLVKLFPEYAFISTILYMGGLFAIIGTLHSMIWSVGVLLLDVLKRMQSPFVRSLVRQSILQERTAVILASLVIALSACVFVSETILNLTVCLVAVAYILSMSLLFKSEAIKNVKTLLLGVCAVAGGVTLIVYSLLPFFA